MQSNMLLSCLESLPECRDFKHFGSETQTTPRSGTLRLARRVEELANYAYFNSSSIFLRQNSRTVETAHFWMLQRASAAKDFLRCCTRLILQRIREPLYRRFSNPDFFLEPRKFSRPDKLLHNHAQLTRKAHQHSNSASCAPYQPFETIKRTSFQLHVSDVVERLVLKFTNLIG